MYVFLFNPYLGEHGVTSAIYPAAFEYPVAAINSAHNFNTSTAVYVASKQKTVAQSKKDILQVNQL